MQKSSGNPDLGIAKALAYRFDADMVELNAELAFSAQLAAVGPHWALQLWASDCGFPGGQPAGIKVAEVAVSPMLGGQAVSALAPAMPPATSREQHMALVLVNWDQTGAPVTQCLFEYAGTERFVQPRLEGDLSCRLGDGMANLSSDAIVNPRAADNLSGTLALEVWALDAPYAGGAWQGIPVASVVLGVLAGGDAWRSSQFSVPAAQPADSANLVVMLREWSPSGYVTRDYRNLDQDGRSFAAPEPAKKPSPKAGPSKAGKAAAAAKTTAVSVNQASAAALAAVKGMSQKLAEAIVAARPYTSLEELSKAKGMGPKLLTKLRGSFTL